VEVVVNARLVEVSAGATVANMGPGFDVLGLCLDDPRDSVVVERIAGTGVTLASIEGDGGILPLDSASNCAGIAASSMLRLLQREDVGLRMTLSKGLPLGSGLGSSAASSVAGALATARLLMASPDMNLVLSASREGERLASGSPHPDNVAPCLYGGIVACLPGDAESVEVIQLSAPSELHVCCVSPGVTIRTADARAVLPAAIPMEDAVANIASVAGLVHGLSTSDWGLLSRCLNDRMVTPYRQALIPGCAEALAAAKHAGALGSGISGSGPTVFALTVARDVAVQAAHAMADVFQDHGLGAIQYVGAVDSRGARVERVEEY